MKLLISAAEISSDLHAAYLVDALRARLPVNESLQLFGVGGACLQKKREFCLVADARNLLAMGSTEVLGRLPAAIRTLRLLLQVSLREKPDLALVIDYPDFHFKLAAQLKAQGVPVLYYIPPKTWVWRKSRIKTLKKVFSKILCIFPFEEEFYKKEGLEVHYVGNPLLDELPLELTQKAARHRLLVSEQDCVLTLMPGSRPAEIKRHFPLLIEATCLAIQTLKAGGRLEKKQTVQVLIPVPAFALCETNKLLKVKLKNKELNIQWKILEGDSALCLRASDVALVKSGTSTLEAGLLNCPHVVFYKPSGLTNFIFNQFLGYRGPIGLINLVGGWKPGQEPQESRHIVKELIGHRVNVKSLSNELISLLTDPERREGMREEFKKLREKLKPLSGGGSPSDHAALEVLKFYHALNKTFSKEVRAE